MKDNNLRILQGSKKLLIALSLLAILGVLFQYSVNNATFHGKPLAHTIRLLFSVLLVLVIARSNINFWHSWAYHIYFFTLFLLLMVSVFGFIGMGAQRWINLYFVNIQPSELIKLSMLLALSRYCSDRKNHLNANITYLLMPFFIIVIPAIIILKQPDLGTASIVLCAGLSVLFIKGENPKYWLFAIITLVLSMPIFWNILHDYQKNRILTFLNPEKDPFGAGYHVMQSKIALGSGGWFGKGFLMGTQSKLSFLPEKHTDFIFAAICEEIGFIGGSIIILLYTYVVISCLKIARKSPSKFSMFLSTGLSILIGSHALINIAMVMGMVPVVGIPLPIISYGGSSMLNFSIAIGILLCINSSKKISQ